MKGEGPGGGLVSGAFRKKGKVGLGGRVSSECPR